MSTYHILGGTTPTPDASEGYAWPTYSMILDDGEENVFVLGASGVSRTLKKGMSGQDVRALQEILIKKGFLVPGVRPVSKVADGIFGPETETAVVDYQKSNGLRVDGEAGPETAASLGLVGAPLKVVSFTEKEAGDVQARQVVIEKIKEAQEEVVAATKIKIEAKTPAELQAANQKVAAAVLKADAVSKDASAPPDVRMTAEEVKKAAAEALTAQNPQALANAWSASLSSGLHVDNLSGNNFLSRRYGPLPGYVWALFGVGALCLGAVALSGRGRTPAGI